MIDGCLTQSCVCTTAPFKVLFLGVFAGVLAVIIALVIVIWWLMVPLRKDV